MAAPDWSISLYMYSFSVKTKRKISRIYRHFLLGITLSHLHIYLQRGSTDPLVASRPFLSGQPPLLPRREGSLTGPLAGGSPFLPFGNLLCVAGAPCDAKCTFWKKLPESCFSNFRKRSESWRNSRLTRWNCFAAASTRIRRDSPAIPSPRGRL